MSSPLFFLKVILSIFFFGTSNLQIFIRFIFLPEDIFIGGSNSFFINNFRESIKSSMSIKSLNLLSPVINLIFFNLCDMSGIK